MIGICPLGNPIREYAWGSRSAIAELLGRPTPSLRPQAELWMGAHPKDPSRARCRGNWISLPELLRDHSEEILGKRASARYGGELPFLFKVLAVAQPLSIQAHPDRAQACEGFARENAAGIALDAPERNYSDPHPKPELVCALSPFSALCGFRAASEIGRSFRALQIDAFAGEVDAMEREGDAQALARFFSDVWNAPAHRIGRAIEQAATNAKLRSDDPAARWVAAMAALYPRDAGVFAPLLLNLVTLAPGEAMYLAAGEMHSYLEGVAIEIMGNSDNVLRGGLTEKHVDIPELCRVLRYEPREPEVLAPREIARGERVFATPAEEFELAVIDVEEGETWRSGESRGVEILLAVEGELAIADEVGGESFGLARGASVLVPSSVHRYALSGAGVVYRARTPGG